MRSFEYMVDFGAVGPDKGEGGKYLFLPPGYDGKVPDGHFVVRSPSYRVWVMMRGFGEVGKGKQAVAWFKKHLQVYPLATGPRNGNLLQRYGRGDQLARTRRRYGVRYAQRNRAV